MASAPTPGVGRQIEQTESAKDLVTIEIPGFPPATIAMNNVPLTEKMVVMKATDRSWEWWVGDEGRGGELAVVFLWWMARRRTNEPMLTWTTAMDEWPEGITDEDIKVDQSEAGEGADSPEA